MRLACSAFSRVHWAEDQRIALLVRLARWNGYAQIENRKAVLMNVP